MSIDDLGNIFQVGVDVLSSERNATTGTLTLNLGDSTDAETLSSNAENWQPFGFASRPAKPTSGHPSAQAAVLKTGGVDVCVAGRDVRCQAIYGSLNYGETAVFASGNDGNGQARTLWKADGSVNHYTRVGNDPNGAGMLMQLDAANNAVRLLNGLGFALIIDTGGITLTTGKASLKLGSDGSISLVGTAKTQIDGTSIVLGSLVAPVTNAALHGPTGISGAPSLKTLIE